MEQKSRTRHAKGPLTNHIGLSRKEKNVHFISWKDFLDRLWNNEIL